MDIVISKLLNERIQVIIFCRSLIDETMKLIKKIRWQIFIEQLFYLWKVSCLTITLALFAFQNFIIDKVRRTLIFFCLTLNFSLSLFNRCLDQNHHYLEDFFSYLVKLIHWFCHFQWLTLAFQFQVTHFESLQ